MQAARNLLRAAPQMTKTVVPARNMSAIATPPRNKVSKGEELFLCGIMVIGWSAIPAWVLVNMKHYRDKE